MNGSYRKPRLKPASILRYGGVAVIAFLIGLFTAPEPTFVRTDLEAISADVRSYDGKIVEVETYAQLDSFSESDWTAGEPFEKLEVFTYLKLAGKHEQLREQLISGLTDSSYSRVRVSIRGRVRDNCAPGDGIAKCCFGDSITIEDALIVQIGEIERYSRPAP